MSKQFHFLLAGSGFFCNRGCEAIIRGTAAILRHEFGPDIRLTVATFAPSFGHREVIERQAAAERDSAINFVWLPPPELPPLPHWTPKWLRIQFWRACGRISAALGRPLLSPNTTRQEVNLSSLDRLIGTTDCALQVGGDNYSLDYGMPIGFMRLDRYCWSHGVPMVLWGASVGPFDANRQFRAEMFKHLRNLSGVFVRETKSRDYLREHGVDQNVQLVADPAFMMEPVRPPEDLIGCRVPEGALGINFGPLMARYVSGGDPKACLTACIEIIRRVAGLTDRPILLVPHVTCSHDDDFALLKQVAVGVGAPERVSCVGNGLSAAQVKWVISRCVAFCGLRTHSTIAAFSTGVPTLSLAYSTKAMGLNRDLFGSLEYCVEPRDFNVHSVSERFVQVCNNAGQIRAHLEQVLPGVRAASLRSGTLLRSILGARDVRVVCDCRVCRCQ